SAGRSARNDDCKSAQNPIARGKGDRRVRAHPYGTGVIMRKSKPPNTDATKQERTERVLDVLDAAVTAEPDLDTPAHSSTPSEGLEALPERLRDPFAVLERGRALLRTGLPMRDSRVNTDFDDELRMAA